MAVYLPVRVRYVNPSDGSYVEDVAPSLPYGIPAGPAGVSAVSSEFYFDVPAISSLSAVQVAVWVAHPNVGNPNGLEIEAAGAGHVDYDGGLGAGRIFGPNGSVAPLGPGLGTSAQDAIFDIDADAPTYWADDEDEWAALPPIPGRWQAANAYFTPGDAFPASVFALDTGNPDAGYTGAWRVLFRSWWAVWDAPDPPMAEDVVAPAYTVNRVALIINEPFNYGGPDPGDNEPPPPGPGGSGPIPPVVIGGGGSPPGGTVGGAPGSVVAGPGAPGGAPPPGPGVPGSTAGARSGVVR